MKPCSNTTARVLRLALMSTLLITVAGDASAATTKVDIDTVPPGVQVFLADIEGEESPLGTTPLSAVRLPRGQHTLRFSKEGYKALVETLEVGKRPSRFVFKLERKTRPGTLEFRALERFHGAAIAIDGKVVGALPTTVPVPAGRHLAKITKEGYEPWERWFDVKEGEQLPVDVTLSALSAPMGSLLVTSNPSGAEVRVDGVGRGVAPTAIQGLAPGSHRVTLQLEGYAPYDKEVTISVGEQAVLEAVLESAKPTTGSIKVLANAEGASLRFDGEAVGKAPFTREGIAPGLHLIEATLKRRGCKLTYFATDASALATPSGGGLHKRHTDGYNRPQPTQPM